MADTAVEIAPETIIGDILDAYPEAKAVVEAYFGAGCFTCPGIRLESLAFGALMHGKDIEELVRDLRMICGTE